MDTKIDSMINMKIKNSGKIIFGSPYIRGKNVGGTARFYGISPSRVSSMNHE